MVISDWLGETILWKAVLKCVIVDCGARSVVVDGILLMHLLHAGNLDSLAMVIIMHLVVLVIASCSAKRQSST